MTGLASPRVEHPEWYREVITPGVDPSRPGIYEWRIESVGVYIGQYTWASRPRREYGANVARLLAKRHYRPKNPDGFRHIHHQLALAVGEKRPITLTFLENQADKTARNARERHFIRSRQIAAAGGDLRVLNSV